MPADRYATSYALTVPYIMPYAIFYATFYTTCISLAVSSVMSYVISYAISNCIAYAASSNTGVQVCDAMSFLAKKDAPHGFLAGQPPPPVKHPLRNVRY